MRNILAKVIAAAGVVFLCAGLAGCSGNKEKAEDAKNCPPMTIEQALQAAMDKSGDLRHVGDAIRKVSDNGVPKAATKNFDTCNDLTYISLDAVKIKSKKDLGVTTNKIVLLYHKNKYISPMRNRPMSEVKSINQKSPNTLTVTYGDDSGDEARSTYRWDKNKGGVTRDGDLLHPEEELPGKASDKDKKDEPRHKGNNSDGAASNNSGGSGGCSTPVSGAACITKGVPSGAKKLGMSSCMPAYEGSAAMMRSPSGAIMCEVQADGNTMGCDVKFNNRMMLGQEGPDPNNYVVFSSGQPAAGTHKGDVRCFSGKEGSIYVVPYGTTAYYGNMACRSEFNGFTCWNVTTGHGAFMAREHFKPF